MTAIANDRLSQNPTYRDPSEVDPDDDLLDRSIAATAATQGERHYATAVPVQKSRRLSDVQRRIQDEAAMAGADFYYGWGAGKDKIEGPSVKLANALARCWGNCVVDALPVQELADSWVFTAAFIDLETGYTLTRQFRQSKNWKVFGKHDEERKADIRFQIGQSKATRNVILNALPSYLIDAAMSKAKEGVRTKIEQYIKENGIVKAVDAILQALAKCGVKEDAVLARSGRASRSGIDVDDIVILKGDLLAIQGGQERAEALFPLAAQAKPAEAPPPPPKTEAAPPAEKQATPTEIPVAEAHPPGGKITKKQTTAILGHFMRLKMGPPEIDNALAPFKVLTLKELTIAQADTLLLNLQDCQGPEQEVGDARD